MIHHAVLTTVAVAVLSLAVLGPPVQAQDKPSAQELADLRARAEAGDTSAQVSLGLRYVHGLGVQKDAVEGAAWFRKVAEQGIAVAQFTLGRMYYTAAKASRRMSPKPSPGSAKPPSRTTSMRSSVSG